MKYEDVLAKAREVLMPKCRVCKECDGVACRGEVPGLGGAGDGSGFTECRRFFRSIKVRMDAVHENYDVDTSIEMFGRRFAAPFFVAPVGGLPMNFTGYLSEEEYTNAAVKGALDAGIFAFTGDGPLEEYFPGTLPAIREAKGVAVSTIKPWDNEKVYKRIDTLNETGVMAFAMDIDSAALVNLKLKGKPAYPKSVEELKSFARRADMPFLVKGIMTGESAVKCQDAGAYGVVVSTHGGRISQDFAVPASMVYEIRQAVGPDFTIIVDGGIRSGADVFKCLALGADAVLIGRPFAIAAHGGGAEGVKIYADKIREELSEIMKMTDCRTLDDITADKLIF